MKILFAASEAAPFAKTGGLGDVVGSLPKALDSLGHDVRVIMPRYRSVGVEPFGLHRVLEPMTVWLSGKPFEVTLYESVLPGTQVPIYFVDQPTLFDREGLYQEHGADYPDNLERFSVFAQAVLQAVPQLGWQPEMLHAHDWQAGLLVAHRALTRATDPLWQSVATVFTIHNLAYQGVFPQADWWMTGLPYHAFTMDGLEFYGRINCLKGGLVHADQLTTVSPTYAREIQTRQFGCGLEGLLATRRDALTGILNGIDDEAWDPKTDPHLAAHYSAEELAGKSICKLSLQERLRLPQRHGLLLGMVQRLVEQKGIDLFLKAAPELLKLDVQVAILGTGDPGFHAQLTELAKRYPEQVSVTLTFDDSLAHQIEAGSDAFLMASRFEPCGLNQFYSMRYGSVPIVHRVGGLADSVTDVSPKTLEDGTATGFVFDVYTSAALLDAVSRAVAAFRDHGLWYTLVRSGMRQDWSWRRSAREYLAVYERAACRGPIACGAGS